MSKQNSRDNLLQLLTLTECDRTAKLYWAQFYGIKKSAALAGN